MFEVAETFLIQFAELLPTIIGLVVLFDLMGDLLPHPRG